MQLEGKVAVISGAGSGIGRATALLLASEGAKVATIDRTPKNSQETVNQIQQQGGEAITVEADISQPEKLQQAYEQIYQKWGHINLVFANAGINGVWAPIEDLDPQEWNKTISINLTGTFLTIKYAVPYLKQQGGAIVINSSVNGTRMFSNTGATAYSSTKAAQVAMAKMLAVELARKKIRINVICPGAIDTEIDDNTEQQNLEKVEIPVEFPEGEIPLTGKNPGKSEQVAQLVLFLLSDNASHITGTEVWIDGGQSLLEG
ncbi:3-oxoacyl-[acyl-carrier-protein] reductase [Aphanothece hegewaldii CCALA 016]|uniref:3-oxoacyl-[acyl-carrier-protein] reductase n=1 Tax=Aphanothece hegewaldii CCALA 016 TaxID=2107694 RepID=A0A2T1LUK3_9CHRO|nr:SDR family NAD(P)-dependent oxidoreductase [Aphanothece hegewaldii]PSF35242.1 3-oxoacyl-[acyl-carrier-protein] reductase [Aphanothece hegewaldii CCALA 016]